MKLLNPALYLFVVCCLIPNAKSQEYYDPTGESVAINGARTIRIYVEYFEVSTIELAEIMSIPRRGNDDTKMRADLLTKAKAGKVSILESQTLVTRSGERATTESITEFIYPTEYEISDPIENEKKNSPPTIVVPTAFESRNLGATLEVEPTLGEDGKTIDITFKPEICYHVGDTIWGKEANVTYKMPTIYTLRVNTSCTLTNGKFHFTNALTPKNDKGEADPSKKILVFVKADILKVGL
ncbi:MAG: Flp pilus assembly secretin CpaC [Cryomorphaceae bacterium]|jgi:Flp pilus assembly secretin CpaC